MNKKTIFALTYLGSILGECAGGNDSLAAFYHEDIPTDSYAAILSISPNGLLLWVNDDLPEPIYLQIRGYAAINDIPLEES